MAKKTHDGPFLSFNIDISKPEDLGPLPSPEKLEDMRRVNPALEDTWTIWEQHKQEGDARADYSDAMKESVSFSTVKDFWACWHHIPQPSMLLDNKKMCRETDGKKTVIESIAIFKKGIVPQWEHPANRDGGHFQLTLLTKKLNRGVIDEVWNNVVLGMISGAIEPASMINGCRIIDKLDNPLKPLFRIELWFDKLEGDGGEGTLAYDLRGSFERCMRTCLDGELKAISWGRTDLKPHK